MNIILQVIWNRLYHAESFCDKGTLKHLENIIRRTNVPKKVRDNMSAAQDFYSLVRDAHIVAAALHHFSMPSLDAEPTGIVAPMNPTTLVDFMKNTVGELVDKEVSNPPTTAPPNAPLAQDQQDHVLNYASQVIGHGLMAENFHDACTEGDGGRLHRCWKFLLLHFKENSRTKYALEAFRLIAHTSALLSPRKAHQLIWNHSCNPKGGCGRNIPLDLQNEFMSRVFKDNINTFRSDITTQSINRSSQSIKVVSDTLENFDRVTHVICDSGHHVPPDASEDFQLILQVLQNERVLHLCHAEHIAHIRISVLTP